MKTLKYLFIIILIFCTSSCRGVLTKNIVCERKDSMGNAISYIEKRSESRSQFALLGPDGPFVNYPTPSKIEYYLIKDKIETKLKITYENYLKILPVSDSNLWLAFLEVGLQIDEANIYFIVFDEIKRRYETEIISCKRKLCTKCKEPHLQSSDLFEGYDIDIQNNNNLIVFHTKKGDIIFDVKKECANN